MINYKSVLSRDPAMESIISSPRISHNFSKSIVTLYLIEINFNSQKGLIISSLGIFIDNLPHESNFQSQIYQFIMLLHVLNIMKHQLFSHLGPSSQFYGRFQQRCHQLSFGRCNGFYSRCELQSQTESCARLTNDGEQ